MTAPVGSAAEEVVVALDVGTRIKAAVMTADGTVLHTESADTGAERGADAMVENILTLASALTKRYQRWPRASRYRASSRRWTPG